MERDKRTELLLLLGSSTLFGVAVALHTHVVMSANGTTGDAWKVVQATLLAAGAGFVFALPLGMVLQGLPRRFGTGGFAVACSAAVVAIAVVFASEQALLVALREEPEVGFITTGWVWDRAGWAALPLYLLTIPFDFILMMVAAIMTGLAPFAVPPAAGLCCGVSWVVLALPVLLWGARRAAANHQPPG